MTTYDDAFNNAFSGNQSAPSPYDEVFKNAMPARPDIALLGQMPQQDVEAMKNRAWSDVPLEAVKNIPKSAADFADGIYQAVRHPLDTAGTLMDAAVGGMNHLLPKSLTDWQARTATPLQAENLSRATTTADAIGDVYKSRYGSVGGLKNTIATDPVGLFADLSTVFSAGAGLAGRSAGVQNALSTASKYTNPLSAVAPVLNGAASMVGVPLKHVLGLTTGVGPENISQAFNSGLQNKSAFWDNMTGKVPMADVLDTAKQNLQAMGAKKSADYRSGMIDIKADKSVLDFKNIDQAVQDAANTVSFKGQVKNTKGAQLAQSMSDEIANWKSLDPMQFHTPEGLDALKQKIGGMVESIPFEEKTARMVGGKVYSSIKGEINQQAPTYAKVMNEYATATDQIKEIERALSLGDKASADTGMRKLQSLSRNNVNTNYGNRLSLANQLEAGGGSEILPSIAGQAMNSWTSRGLAGNMQQLATMGSAAALQNPSILGLLPLQSPRVVGALTYGAGQALRPVQGALEMTSKNPKLTPEQINRIVLLLGQAGNAGAGQ